MGGADGLVARFGLLLIAALFFISAARRPPEPVTSEELNKNKPFAVQRDPAEITEAIDRLYYLQKYRDECRRPTTPLTYAPVVQEVEAGPEGNSYSIRFHAGALETIARINDARLQEAGGAQSDALWRSYDDMPKRLRGLSVNVKRGVLEGLFLPRTWLKKSEKKRKGVLKPAAPMFEIHELRPNADGKRERIAVYASNDPTTLHLIKYGPKGNITGHSVISSHCYGSPEGASPLNVVLEIFFLSAHRLALIVLVEFRPAGV